METREGAAETSAEEKSETDKWPQGFIHPITKKTFTNLSHSLILDHTPHNASSSLLAYQDSLQNSTKIITQIIVRKNGIHFLHVLFCFKISSGFHCNHNVRAIHPFSSFFTLQLYNKLSSKIASDVLRLNLTECMGQFMCKFTNNSNKHSAAQRATPIASSGLTPEKMYLTFTCRKLLLFFSA